LSRAFSQSDLTGLTLRTLEAGSGCLPAFARSCLANTVGVSATVVTRDGFLLLPRRNARVHVNRGLTSSSTSGVLEWSTVLFQDFAGALESQLLIREATAELLLDAHAEVIALAFVREMQRAGKPQFFFHIWTEATLAQLRQRWTTEDGPAEEYAAIQWVRVFDPAMLLSTADEAAETAARRLASLVAATAPLWFGASPVVLAEEARVLLLYLGLFLHQRGAAAFPSAWLRTSCP
jgi:hypothetical protein